MLNRVASLSTKRPHLQMVASSIIRPGNAPALALRASRDTTCPTAPVRSSHCAEAAMDGPLDDDAPWAATVRRRSSRHEAFPSHESCVALPTARRRRSGQSHANRARQHLHRLAARCAGNLRLTSCHADHARQPHHRAPASLSIGFGPSDHLPSIGRPASRFRNSPLLDLLQPVQPVSLLLAHRNSFHLSAFRLLRGTFYFAQVGTLHFAATLTQETHHGLMLWYDDPREQILFAPHPHRSDFLCFDRVRTKANRQRAEQRLSVTR